MSNPLFVVVVLGVGYFALKRWLAYVSRRASAAIPIVRETYGIANDEVPADTREIFEERTAPLVALGFERLGLLRAPGVLTNVARTYTVLRHPTEHAFAIVTISLLGHDMGMSVELVTLYDDGTWVSTRNSGSHFRKVDLPHVRYGEALVSTFAEVWKAHREATAVAASGVVPVELPAIVDHLNFEEAESMRLLVARGEAFPTDDPARFRRAPASAQQRVSRLAAGINRVAAAASSGREFAAPRLPLEEQERHYLEGSLGRQLRRDVSRPKLVFVLTAVAFAASMSAFAGEDWLAFLMPVVLFHELGHWTVMRLFGHKDATIAFIPFLGAATTTSKPFAKRWQEVAMLLAGPLPGIVLGIVITVAPVFQRWPRAHEAGLFMIGLNALNLLPLNPLDGGRILHVLATAGRPRFDLALRALATVAFMVWGVKSHEPVVILLGLFGLLALRTGYRNSALEIRVRRSPGFDVKLPAPQKRAFIFAALSDPPVRRFRTWLDTITALELSLRHARTPLWEALSWTGAFALGIGGIAFLVVSASRPLKEFQCPSPLRAPSVSCAAAPGFAEIDWQPVAPAAGVKKKAGRRPSVVPTSELKAAAFVWCSLADEAKRVELADRLREAAAGTTFCEALPWERPTSDVPEEVRRNARATLARYGLTIDVDHLVPASQRRLAWFDHLVDRQKGTPGFDVDTATLYRRTIDPAQQPAEEAKRALGERLGRSPAESCKRIAIQNVRITDGKEPPASGVPAVANAEAPGEVIRFATLLANTADFGELGAYLCQAGCQIQVQPEPPDDLRLSVCF